LKTLNIVVATPKKGGLILSLKEPFISLTKLTEYTEKDNYHFSFAAEAPQMKIVMPGRYWLSKPAPRDD
jgi:hypothetical protein